MSTITKERIELFIKNPLENGLTRSEQMEVARIALASLEADPIGEVSEKRYGLIMDGTVDLGGKSTYRIIKGEKAMKLFPLSDAADGADLRSPVLPAITPSFYHHPTPFAVNGGFANQTKTVSKIKAIAAIRKISFAEIESDCWVISLLISLRTPESEP